MQKFTDLHQKAWELIRVGRFFFRSGWVPATSGNFSARLDSGDVAITVSGRHKGDLTERDIMVVNLDGQPLTDQKPSAETLLHTRLYRRNPDAGAVLHTHSANATVLSRLHRDALRLVDYEVLKALPGVASHQETITVPIFANDQDIRRLAGAVEAYLDSHPPVYGYLIAGHGFYTWGRTVADARRHVEAFEFLFQCEMLLQRISQP
ncbi:MAG: methylthioribulose 1-phosphate dehydratase [Pseudomonadota bacterium]|nr:methylthioribulose 1-phosphate dehydratase [Pseudomonadota bacterium]